MDNSSIARVLAEIADLMEIKGENSFRIRSYRVAADSIAALGRPVAEMVRTGESLRTLPGIGEGIAAKIHELVDSGRCTYHVALLEEVPYGLLELLQVPGLGPKGVGLIWTRLGVRSAADLEAAIEDGRFRTLPGMKEKKEARIRKGLAQRRQAVTRFLLPEVEAVAERLSGALHARGAQRVELAGSYRRRKETVGDLDLIAVGDGATLSEAVVCFPDVKEVLAQGEAKTSVVLTSGLQVDVRPMPEHSLGAALQYFTGSQSHNVALRERAVRRGLKLNEYGLFRVEDDACVADRSEEDVYAALGLAWIPPELREDRGEIAAAENRSLPRLLELSDLQGDLHAHTVESDGRDTLEGMARAAQQRGLRYLALTEHSRAIPSPKRGTGMDEARCLEHIRRIRAYEERSGGIRLLAGVEVDILPDGRLDMADDVLAQLDVVVASLHSRLEMETQQMTDRLLRAFENPYLQIWGHPLARILRRRAPVQLDTDRVLAAAAAAGVALEINSQPDRLDLPDHLIRPARERGIRFVVSSDSHAVTHFQNLIYGIAQARRGWLTPEDVLNTSDADLLRQSLRRPA